MITSRTKIRVRYADTDRMGRVYYARYLEWFECGRSQYFRDIGLPYTQLEATGIFLPVMEVHCRYRNAPAYDEIIVVETNLDQPLLGASGFFVTL